MDFFLVEKIAVKRLQQRCLDYDRANLLVRVDRRTGVIVPRAEWNAIGAHFRQQIRSSARVLRWGIILQIPVGLLLLSLVTSSPMLERAWDAIDNAIIAGFAWLVLSTALPVAGLIHHGRAVGGAIHRIVDELATRPRVPIPPRAARRGLHAIEIVALVLFGPGVFIELYGSIFPHAFDYTPWMGQHLQWDGIIGLAAFVVILLRQIGVRRATLPLAEGLDPSPRLIAGGGDAA